MKTIRAAVVLSLALLAVSAVAQYPASVNSPGVPNRGMAPTPSANINSPGRMNGPENCCGTPTPLVPSAMGIRNPFFNTNVSTNGVEQGRSFHLRPRQGEPVVVPYPYYVPYAVPVTADEYEEPEEPAEPLPPGAKPLTLFDRRPVAPPAPEPAPAAVAEAPRPRPAPEPEREQEPTLLIFKDGKRLEIQNFAIVGETVIVLSPEYRKVPLSDLDLPATIKENDERGTDFRVPGQKGS